MMKADMKKAGRMMFMQTDELREKRVFSTEPNTGVFNIRLLKTAHFDI